VAKYLGNACIIQKFINDFDVVSFTMSNDILELLQFAMKNSVIDNKNDLDIMYINEQAKYKKKNKSIKKIASQTVKNIYCTLLIFNIYLI